MTMAAQFTKNDVRTTFTSGNRSKLRKLGCHDGASATAARSPFFSLNRDIVIMDDETEQPEPAQVPANNRRLCRKSYPTGLQPRLQVGLEPGHPEQTGDGSIKPSHLRRHLHAKHLADRLPGLHFIETDRRLQLLDQFLDQRAAHAGKIEGIRIKKLLRRLLVLQ